MSDWQDTTLGAICESGGGRIQTGPFGSQLHASDYVESGIPSVMPQNIGDNYVIEDGIARITEDDAIRLAKYRLKTNDIVYSRRGDVERRALIRPANNGWLCGTGCLKVTFGDNPQADPAFVAYQLGTEESRAWIVRHAVGATMLNLNTTILSNVPLRMPSLAVQRSIAEILGALDEKIAANTKLIASMDSLAQTQFQAALNDSQPKPLSSLAQFVNGKAFTKGASGTGRVVVRIAELNSGIGNSTVFSDAEVDDKHVVRPGDTLFAWSGSLTLHRWFRDEAIVNQHIFKVIPNGETPDWLIYELLRNKLGDFKMIAANKATTMGHIQRKHLDEPVLVPSEPTQREIAPDMESLWQTALNTERENLTLAATRDVLVPQLMSGKLRVKEAEELVAASL